MTKKLWGGLATLALAVGLFAGPASADTGEAWLSTVQDNLDAEAHWASVTAANDDGITCRLEDIVAFEIPKVDYGLGANRAQDYATATAACASIDDRVSGFTVHLQIAVQQFKRNEQTGRWEWEDIAPTERNFTNGSLGLAGVTVGRVEGVLQHLYQDFDDPALSRDRRARYSLLSPYSEPVHKYSAPFNTAGKASAALIDRLTS